MATKKDTTSSSNNKAKRNARGAAAAWQDEDDAGVQVNISEVARLRKLRKNEQETAISGVEYQERLKTFYNNKLSSNTFYKWAKAGEGDADRDELSRAPHEYGDGTAQDSGGDDADNEDALQRLLKSEIQFYKERDEAVPQGVLDLERVGAVRTADKHDAVVQGIDFHGNGQVFLTCGLDKLVKIFSISQSDTATFRTRVKLAKQIYQDGLPMLSARFVSSRNEVLCAGLKKHLLCHSLESDKIEKVSSHLFTKRFDRKISTFALSPREDRFALFNDEGYVLLLDARSKTFQFEVKLNEACTAAAFSADAQYLFTAGAGGKLYQWDLAQRRVFDVFEDSGSYKTNVIDARGGYVATGTQGGTVNVYAYDRATHRVAKAPLREVQNLTTAVSGLTFGGAANGDVLAASSKWKKNAIRLVHAPTQTVYQNWPNLRTNLKFVTAHAFSRDARYFAVGNDCGRVSLYELKHYAGK